jgi:hypothetical protein
MQIAARVSRLNFPPNPKRFQIIHEFMPRDCCMKAEELEGDRATNDVES